MNHELFDHSDEAPDDLVRQAIESIENEAVPPGPPAELLASTIRALNGLAGPRSQPRKFRGRMIKFAAIAAALLLAVSLLPRLMPTVESPHAFGEEFGRALEQVREGHSMSYVQEMAIEGKAKPIVVKEFIAEDGRKRSENGFATTIFDTSGHIRLTLTDVPRPHPARVLDKRPNPGSSPPAAGADHFRTAIVGEPADGPGHNAGKMFLNWLERLKELGDRPEKELGRKELDGHQVTGFVASEGKRTFTMWVDNASGQPVRIEYDSQVNGKLAHITMRDFHFDESLDESLFSFDVPKGYEIYGRPKDGAIEPTAGFEPAWSIRGRWKGVASAIHGPTVFGLEHGGRLTELNSDKKVVATFQIGERGNSFRVAKLLVGQECQFVTFRFRKTVDAYRHDGQLLWSYTNAPDEADASGADDVWPADLNGDGLDELIIGYGGGGGVHVLDPTGRLLWKNTDRGNIWHVAAGDVAGDAKPEVLTTCAEGKVQVFDAGGNRLEDISPDFYASLVRTWQPMTAESPERPNQGNKTTPACQIIIAGGGTDNAQLAALNRYHKTLWSLGLSAPVANAAIAVDRPWLALSLNDGNVRVVDLAAGKEIAHLGGQGGNAGVAWLPDTDGPPLLVIAAGRTLQAFRVTAARP